MKMNAFVSKDRLDGIICSIYSITGLNETIENEDKFRMAWKISRVFNSTAAPFMNGEKVLLIGTGPKKVSKDNLVATLEGTKVIDLKNPAIRKGIVNILNQELKERMRSKGYLPETGVVIPRTPKIYNLENGEPILVYENAAKYQIEVLENGHVLVYIDPKVRVKQSALVLISWLKENKNDADITEIMAGKPVFLEPHGMNGKITKLDWERSPGTYEIDTPVEIQGRAGKDKITVQEFWAIKYQMKIPPDEKPMIMVQLKGRDTSVPYPASMVSLSTKGKSYSKAIRDTFTKPSIDRIEDTKKMAKLFLGEPFKFGNMTLSFEMHMVDTDRLKKIGLVLEIGCVSSPTLLMGNGKTGSLPKDITKYGPYSGPRVVPIYYMIPHMSGLDVARLHDIFQGLFSKLGLGELEMIGSMEIRSSNRRPSRNDYWDAAKTAGIKIDEYMGQRKDGTLPYAKPILISVLPDKDSEVYAGGKSGAHSEGRSIQNIILKTAKTIIHEDKPYSAYNILMQVYLKALEIGEAPWILSEPAGGAEGTAYIGYDVSRRRDEESGSRKEAAATISMVDGLGRSLYNKMRTSQSGETLDQLTANRMVFEVTSEAHKDYQKRSQAFRRLVIFKDGIIHYREADNIKKGVIQAIADMQSKETMPHDIDVELISVVKSGIERLYEDNGHNPKDGTYVIFTDGTAVITTSDLGNRDCDVTVQTTRLEPKFKASLKEVSDGKAVDIKKLVKEFSDLCSLDWASIYKQSKYPIVLRLVQNLGEQYTLDIEDPPYLPL